MVEIQVEPHPLLLLRAFTSHFAARLGGAASPPFLTDLLRAGAETPFEPDEALRGDVRDLLRHGGYKPTGRGKPASEYLVRAAADGTLQPINLAVDACNVASLHGGFPISVVDLDRAHPPLRVAIAPAGIRYVFNASGQEIDAAGLICLFDAAGACANAVKDAQRTKTDDNTARTLSILWGTHAHAPRLQAVTEWYRGLLHRADVETRVVP